MAHRPRSGRAGRSAAAAWLASEVKKSKGSAIAVVLVGSKIGPGVRRAKAKEARAALDRAVTSPPGGWVAGRDERRPLHAHDDAGGHRRDAQPLPQRAKSVFDLAVKPPKGAPTVLGIGFGGTFATALDSAQQAFQVSAQSGEPAMIAGRNGESIFGDDGATVSLQETSDAMLELAERTGLGPLTLRHLIARWTGRPQGRDRPAALRVLRRDAALGPPDARTVVSAGYAREAGVRATAAAPAGRTSCTRSTSPGCARSWRPVPAWYRRPARRGALASLAGNAPGGSVRADFVAAM